MPFHGLTGRAEPAGAAVTTSEFVRVSASTFTDGTFGNCPREYCICIRRIAGSVVCFSCRSPCTIGASTHWYW